MSDPSNMQPKTNIDFIKGEEFCHCCFCGIIKESRTSGSIVSSRSSTWVLTKSSFWFNLFLLQVILFFLKFCEDNFAFNKLLSVLTKPNLSLRTCHGLNGCFLSSLNAGRPHGQMNVKTLALIRNVHPFAKNVTAPHEVHENSNGLSSSLCFSLGGLPSTNINIPYRVRWFSWCSEKSCYAH